MDQFPSSKRRVGTRANGDLAERETVGGAPSCRSSAARHRIADEPPAASLLASGSAHRGQPPDHLLRVLRRHAVERPDQTAFVCVLDSQTDDAVLTFAQLDRRARAVAVRLGDMGLAGQRVLLAYPHGLDFIIGLFGCIYAGCTATPMRLPRPRTLRDFLAIAADADACLVLSAADSMARHQAMIAREGEPTGAAAAIPWIATDKITDEAAARWKAPVIAGETPAMLQYTSGSTDKPKGVLLSHANLMHNTRAIHRSFGMGMDTGMFWLPMYHDMGLVGGVLAPVLAGITNVLMSPAAFLRDPIAWLAGISKHRATISGGPNFAYELCARKITDAQRATLDLSCWRVAFIGAEPMQPETLERFTAALAPCGFDATAFCPCYGLAEATLMVSCAEPGRGPTVRAFRETALAEHRVEPVPGDAAGARRIVSCGTPVGDLRVAIVDAHTLAEVRCDRVGEIWVAGASIGQGYWRRSGRTNRSFNAHISNTGEGPFLRTGDMGFECEGHIYIVGRLDDMLIVHGLNHHPQDLEATARRSHPLLAAGIGAAFAVDTPGNRGGGQRLVLVHEVSRDGERNYARALEAARAAVLAEHDLALHTILLVRGGTVPKTSSGKVQRRACRSAFLAGELKELAVLHRAAVHVNGHGHGDGATAVSGSVYAGVRGAAPSVAQAERDTPRSFVLATVCQHALALGGVALSDVAPDTPLTALGLDSLQRVELAAMLEKTFACRLPDSEFHPAQTLGELAGAVQKHMNGHAGPSAVAVPIPPAHYNIAQFPEYRELKRYERMLRAVAGDNPYFRVDEGGASSGGVARIEGRDRITFGVYDYIGMAHDPRVTDAAKAAIDRYGTGAGASRLVAGEKRVHRDLERGLATFLGTAAAIVLVSGHAANVTTIGHLMGPEDLIVHDAMAHNSIIQGAQLSGAARRVFAHNDCAALDALLTEMRHRYRRVLIAIEGVYSMDGDYPDLPRFVELKKKHRALLLVDEAHSLGTMGQTGRGIGEHSGVERTDIDLWMGTLSKSLASCGGYIAGSAELIEYLGYTAPGFVYSVGMSPSNAAAALAALKVLQLEPQRVTRLRELSALFLSLAKERGLNTGLSSGTPVIPVIVGNSAQSLRLAQALFDRGVSVQPILHPAVPEHSTRLRFFITVNHSETQIRDAVGATDDELARL